MKKITICICTRKRQEGLTRLLKSIFDMDLGNLNLDIGIVIVENDSEPNSKKLIQKLAKESPYQINYFLETKQGLAFARNRTVKEAGNCDFCCFVDDDQEVAPNWIYELVKCQLEFNADGVSGTNPPIFEKEVHPSVKQFHLPRELKYGTIVEEAYTNCLLLSKHYLDMIDGPFDIRLNFTGGEDNYLTWNFTNKGGVIRYNPNAIAYEIIPENRTKIKFILKRAFRISNESLFIKTIQNKSFSKWKALPKVLLKLAYGALSAIPYLLFYKNDRLNGLLITSRALGDLYFMIGKKNQFYKNSE